MRLKVLKYNKDKAIGKFIYFKFLELVGLFIFIFGFENLGRFVYEKYGMIFDLNIPITYFDFWAYGLLCVLIIILICCAVSIAIWVLILMIVGWFKLNWRWAKLSSEDEDSKIERLSEQKKLKEIRKIEKLEEQRKKYGYCVGDTMVRLKRGTFGKVGGKYIVTSIDDDGYFECKEAASIRKGKFRIVKQKLPKKPKLNKIREKEVNDRKEK